ncbi:hypothetical protein V6M85_12505 [Sulfolobus tengchongensis]|uniref:Nickel/cobalt efflux system n=1 Tax=Sulfolobus tengchongensis TaxID=207809 RepID=A0AAX4L473_9CREN
MIDLNTVLNPPEELSVSEILVISLILGMLHGATPDEHTWPITFSYAIGKYSTKGGMKAGFLFSLGFTIQRAFLTTIGFIGLASFYERYNLDGPVYAIVGIVMAIAGSYILKGRYLHLPIDVLLKSKHHSEKTNGVELRDIPLKMTIVHGLIAGFGFGAYATIITFVLAPKLPSIVFAPLPGAMFGIGTMIMQIIFGAIFGSIIRTRRLTEEQVSYIARKTAGRVLYYGGLVFVIAGLLIIAFPAIDNFAISTGNPIPNLDAIDIGFLLVITVVGIIGISSLILGIKEANRLSKSNYKNLGKL